MDLHKNLQLAHIEIDARNTYESVLQQKPMVAELIYLIMKHFCKSNSKQS